MTDQSSTRPRSLKQIEADGHRFTLGGGPRNIPRPGCECGHDFGGAWGRVTACRKLHREHLRDLQNQEIAQRRIFVEVADERRRQEELRHQGRFYATCADGWLIGEAKVAILTKKVGDVARCALESIWGDAIDASHHELRKELIQVAAVAVAWIEALDNPSEP